MRVVVVVSVIIMLVLYCLVALMMMLPMMLMMIRTTALTSGPQVMTIPIMEVTMSRPYEPELAPNGSHPM